MSTEIFLESVGVGGTKDVGGLEVEMWKNGVPIKTGNSV